MGATKTFKYKIVWKMEGVVWTDMVWDTKTYGKATAKNLLKVVEKYNASIKPGGVNHDPAVKQKILGAVLVEQETGIVCGTAKVTNF